ncbi:MAG: hypothetical protein OEZ10_04835 [Gammaproteobacteria bacterium]|nr:hypothetical protein [Gammaproteobacteria bacterium]
MSRPPRTSQSDRYIGIDEDLFAGMTTIGKMIRDAWVFGLIEETETCKGWNLAGINVLLDKVNAEWDKYGCLVSRLPAELFERHQRIHGEAVEKARELGWDGDYETHSDT